MWFIEKSKTIYEEWKWFSVDGFDVNQNKKDLNKSCRFDQYFLGFFTTGIINPDFPGYKYLKNISFTLWVKFRISVKFHRFNSRASCKCIHVLTRWQIELIFSCCVILFAPTKNPKKLLSFKYCRRALS